MPVYHSVVVEADGKSNGSENAKTLYIIPKTRPERSQKRCGTFAKVLAVASMVLILLFLLASLAKYLYETFGPEPEKQTYDATQEFESDNRSEFSRFLSSKYTIKVVAVILLAILGKFVWGEDDE